MEIDKKIKQRIKDEAWKKARRLWNTDPVKMTVSLDTYLYNFAIKVLEEYATHVVKGETND